MGNHENCGKSAGETVQMKCIQYEIEKLLSDTLPSPPHPSYPWPALYATFYSCLPLALK